jgi:ABC-type Fe3+-hydroxamate transport system substrate-binding protein
MLKKCIAFFLCILMSFSVFSACSTNSSSKDKSSEAVTGTTIEDKKSTQASPTTLDFWVPISGETMNTLQILEANMKR